MTISQKQDAAARVWVAVAWAAVVAAAIVAYWPGLSGPWLFDDFGSIANLADLGGVRNWETFKAFVFGGTAGPTGRPLSLLTFLIDGQNWPTDAWPFKRTNLVIHVLNGILLGLLIGKILSVAGFDRDRIAPVALVSAACWILHPFLVSTTLYVVQRMAQLSTLFIFAGLLGYIIGRKRVRQSPRAGYTIMSISLVGFTTLAMISKENGILLPMFALVLESTIFSVGAPTKLNRSWFVLFVVAPSAVIILYLGSRVIDPSFLEVVPPRDFSIYERLLTQSRVLVDYLLNWFIPKLYTTGVFQDHYVKSTGLLAPPSTLFFSILHIGLIAIAVTFRRRLPLVALAILFFYVGHLLESTVINLELYFEHRNYLSSALLFVPLVAYAHQKLDIKVFLLVSVGVLLTLGGFTRYSATIWQDFDLMAATSARKAPNSARAQARHAASLFNDGHIDAAFDVLDRAIENIGPERPTLIVQRVILACHTGRLDMPMYERDAKLLSGTIYDPRVLTMYQMMTDAIVSRKCPAVPVLALESLFESMLRTSPNNDTKSLRYSQLQYFLGYVRASANKPAAAVAAFEASLDSRPNSSSAMAMAAILASNHYPDEALALSEIALRHLKTEGVGALRAPPVTEDDIREFQDVARAESEMLRGAGTSDPAQ
jgi:tetratricopeptide (TPR) repeat protein